MTAPPAQLSLPYVKSPLHLPYLVMLAKRETFQVKIWSKIARNNSDADSVIKVTFTFIFLSKMMKINWLDHFKYHADVPFNMR